MDTLVSIAVIIALIALAVGWILVVRALLRLGNRVNQSLDRADELMTSSTSVVKDVEPSIKKWSATSETVHDEVVEPLINTARSIVNFFPRKKTAPKSRSRS